ncbi:MAG: L,D-transpeptidase [Lachnospiraceae bacterium]|nr:L,D-transpeptidase [Lachnospiraceae bacterium]
MWKWLRILTILLFVIFILPGLIYLGLAIYYQDSFMYGTWINGIYCTGKTIPQVAAELEEQFSYEKIRVITPVNEEVLYPERIGVKYDFITALEEYRKEQNPYNWYRHLTGQREEKMFFPKISFEEEQLKSWLEDTQVYRNNLNLKEDQLHIVWSEKGYVLQEEKEVILNITSAMEKLSEALTQGQEEIDLGEAGCYFYREETWEIQQTRERYEKIEKFQSGELIYKIKEVEKKIQSKELGSFLETDENNIPKFTKNGEVIVSKERVREFISQLAKDYDSWHNYQFITHDGKEIFLTKGNYGTEIHQKKEVEFLMKWLFNREETVREPIYAKDFTYQDSNRLDNTYIEIDMTKQKMFYFKDSQKILETDVVTGCVNKGMATPEMVCYVRAKSRNAILRGPGYRSFVNYWVPVHGGIGIHDATWRNEFGGNIYIKSGSHGCINTPLENMEKLYEMIEKGIPVIIHY